MRIVRPWMALIACALLAPARLVYAIGTAAGTAITNTATANYAVGASAASTTSNTTSVTVIQIVDVVTTVQTPSVSVSSGDTNRVLLFRITNTGNGPDVFTLTPGSNITGDNFDPVLATPAIYFDTDNSGTLTAADVAYAAGADLNLAADAAASLLLVSNIPSGLNNNDAGRSELTATRRSGIGAPGTTFNGQGVGGGAAVVGNSGAQSAQTGQFVVSGMQLAVVKSQSISDQFGGNRVIPGATITYQIVVTPSGSGTAGNTVVSDPIPASTAYRAGTLRLNGSALTDTNGDDAGEYLAAPTPQVSIALGNLTTAGGAQTIEFSVLVN